MKRPRMSAYTNGKGGSGIKHARCARSSSTGSNGADRPAVLATRAASRPTTIRRLMPYGITSSRVSPGFEPRIDSTIAAFNTGELSALSSGFVYGDDAPAALPAPTAASNPSTISRFTPRRVAA